MADEPPGVTDSLRSSQSDVGNDEICRKRSFSSPESALSGLLKRQKKQSSPFVVVESRGDHPPPGERYGQTAVVNHDQGIMYVFGGCNTQRNYFSDELYCFTFKDKTWKVMKPPSDEEGVDDENKKQWPQGRHFHSAVTYRGAMYICGGKSNGYMNDIFSLDFETLEWKEIGTKGKERISRRYGHSAVVHNDSMFVFGGYDDFGLKCNDLWEFNFNAEEWNKIQVQGSPPDRYHHSCVVFEGSLYVFGGYDGYDDLHEYRIGTRTWSLLNTKGAPPSPRWGHRAVSVKRCMYVFGGCDPVMNYNDLHCFHFDTGKWEKMTSGGYSQGYFQSVVVFNDRIYIFGGRNIHNYNFNELYEYRFDVDVKNNPNTFEGDFRNMLFDNDFTDVVFTFPNEGREIKAHRHILFARCSKFRELISNRRGRFASEEVRALLERREEPSSTPTKQRVKRKSRGSNIRNEKTTTATKRRKKKKERSKKKISTSAEEIISLSDDIQNADHPDSSNNSNNSETKKEPEIKTEAVPVIVKEEWKDEAPYVVSIENTKYDTFRRLLEYIYAGSYDISQPHALELLPLAFEYRLEHLKTMCAVKVQQSVNVNNVLVVLTLADKCNTNDLKQYCLSFIAENRKEIIPALQKGELHPDLLKEVKKYLTVRRLEQLQSNSASPIYQTIIT